MHPELFKVPWIGLSVKSFGTMMVVGFLIAVFVMGRMARRSGYKPEWITNAALYAMLMGIVGARMFYVFHHHKQIGENFFDVFAVWQGGWSFWAASFWQSCFWCFTCSAKNFRCGSIWIFWP